ncbi:MAG: LysM domain-containing protein [Methylovulum sp.]|nr:LysM domain-containing protein [Methylovulum sp.]
MAFRTLSGLLFSLLFSACLWAEDIQINPAHPDQYTVVEGDTLWDISAKFLHHAWQWPELWRDNTQIKNPNLIYPGDTIYFSMVNGKPQLSLSRTEQFDSPLVHGPCVLQEEDYKHGRKNFAVDENGKLLPCIREINLKQAIKLIPSNEISAFLTSPKVVGKNDLNDSPYVIGLAGEHIVAGAGDRIYVRSINTPNTISYTVYRPGGAYVSPTTKEILGYEAKYIADVSLQQAGDPATLAITKSNGEIRIGDRTMRKDEEDIILNYFPRPPEKKITGNIISVLDGVSQIGRHNVVVIDKGTKDGLLPGHELEILQQGKLVRDQYSAIKNDTVKLPDEHAGVLMVFRPFERVSYALVMKAIQPIHVLDKVQTP